MASRAGPQHKDRLYGGHRWIYEYRNTTPVSNILDGIVVGALTDLPAGRYMVSARLEYDNDDGVGGAEVCTLGAPGDNDSVDLRVGPSGGASEQQNVSLQKMVSSGGPFSAFLSCTSDGDDDVDQISIIVIALD